MIIAKEYCDRCGKEVNSEPLNMKLFPIICKSARNYFRFRDNPVYAEKTRMVCEDCLNEFMNWWNSGRGA